MSQPTEGTRCGYLMPFSSSYACRSGRVKILALQRSNWQQIRVSTLSWHPYSLYLLDSSSCLALMRMAPASFYLTTRGKTTRNVLARLMYSFESTESLLTRYCFQKVGTSFAFAAGICNPYLYTPRNELSSPLSLTDMCSAGLPSFL